VDILFALGLDPRHLKTMVVDAPEDVEATA
jgi:hypothetical protein